jgi:predicted nicotinamide N-methyase
MGCGDAKVPDLPRAVIARHAGRFRDVSTDPRLDLAVGVLDLHRGRVRFVHPREPTALLDDEDVAADQAYPPYWAEVWESGVELAHVVSARAWTHSTVLELGCGLGLPSLAAALGGARVLATDRSADALAFVGANASQNGVTVETAVCAWADPGPPLARAPWDLVLAADVLYGQRNVDELTDLLPRLVERGEVWVADPGRPLAPEFLAAARERWAAVETLPTRRHDVWIHRLRGPRR